MTLKEFFKRIRETITISPKERAQQKDNPSGLEPGLRHPIHRTHFLLRDDQVVEMSAGPETYVMVDGPGRQVTVKGTSILLNSESLHFAAPRGGFWFGFQRMNPVWFVDPHDTLLPPPIGQKWLWQNAPIVQNFPVSLENAVFLTGTPAPGQVPVPLSTYLRTQPLFGPNEQLLLYARSLATFTRELVVPDNLL